jgi:hypothetical protein
MICCDNPPPPVDIVRLEFNFNGILHNVIHASGFCGEDGGFMKLNAMSLVDTLFSYG